MRQRTDGNRPRRKRLRGGRRHLLLLLVGVAVLVSACAGSGPQTSLEPQGQFARDIDGLWDLVFWMAVGVFVVVTAAYFYALIRFRERKDDDRRPVQVHGNNTLEISWTILPAVILAVLAVPTVQGVFNLREVPNEADVLNISVTGHQWWWEFEYVEFEDDAGRALLTANELHIPAGQEVFLSMTSADVIHSFWVPPLNGKRDVVPGKLTQLRMIADEPTPEGSPILGQCAEFCGLAHADMRIKVFVHEQEAFDAWVADQLQPAPLPVASAAEDGAEAPALDSIAGGWNTFNALCTSCHQASVEYSDGVREVVGPVINRAEARGESFSIALAPDLTHFGSRTSFGGAVFDNVTEHLSEWLA
ncbi:MAG: cytochrome c oxidase subunit II, partial [Acidimicrobiia bacterium]|nr:cytochrome c oxidase subunit II [Acidimicrobiia bacterium]